jgi:sec-independent protein translocase protein TatC
MAPDTSDPSVTTESSFEEMTDDSSRMSFLEHLDELRRRILYSVYAILACCLVTFVYWDPMFRYLIEYFQANGGHLQYTKPASAFMFSLKVGVLAALLVALPFVFTQFWFFVAPGLYAKEKKVVIPFVALSSLLFAGGAYFAHVVGFPVMWKFFASYDQIAGLDFNPILDDTFSFYVKVVLGLGAIFQMPMLVFFLARFGIVTAGFLLKKFKYAVLIIFIAAAVITPSGDLVSQMVFAGPMMVLYGVSIGVAWMFGKKRRP